MLHPVTYTQFIDDVAVIAGPDAQLPAQIGHVDLQLLVPAGISSAPDGFIHRGIGQELACMLGQQRKDVKLRLRQVNGLRGNRNDAIFVFDQQIVQYGSCFPAADSVGHRGGCIAAQRGCGPAALRC